jgi:hypothetical protein
VVQHHRSSRTARHHRPGCAPSHQRETARLTDEAKPAAIAREYLRVKKEIQGLQIAEKTQGSTRWNELAKNLFGLEGFTTAQDAISYRDAQDRVDSIPSTAKNAP